MVYSAWRQQFSLLKVFKMTICQGWWKFYWTGKFLLACLLWIFYIFFFYLLIFMILCLVISWFGNNLPYDILMRVWFFFFFAHQNYQDYLVTAQRVCFFEPISNLLYQNIWGFFSRLLSLSCSSLVITLEWSVGTTLYHDNKSSLTGHLVLACNRNMSISSSRPPLASTAMKVNCVKPIRTN